MAPASYFGNMAPPGDLCYFSASEPNPMTQSQLDRITFNPNQCGGRACIRGMRILVSDILDMLAGGASREEILKDFPYLEDADITAALQYAARSAESRAVLAAE